MDGAPSCCSRPHTATVCLSAVVCVRACVCVCRCVFENVRMRVGPCVLACACACADVDECSYARKRVFARTRVHKRQGGDDRVP